MSTARWVGLTLLVMITTVAVACGGDSEDGDAAEVASGSGETETSPVLPNVLMVITDVQARGSIRELTDYADVEDATLLQTGDSVALELVVGSGISDERAKELADQFMRVVKRRGPDHRPVNQIGTGALDYTIVVSHPGNEVIANGAKLRTAFAITWE